MLSKITRRSLDPQQRVLRLLRSTGLGTTPVDWRDDPADELDWDDAPLPPLHQPRPRGGSLPCPAAEGRG